MPTLPPRTLLTMPLALVVAAIAAVQPTAVLGEAPRPNVLLILADDMTLGDFASRNGGLTRTPNLDRLAAESVQFDRAYSASCVCAPARAAMLTGRYPHRTGVVSLNMNKYPKLTSLHADERTIADVMGAAGYVTGLVGKWHCGNGPDCHPNRRGFDEFEGFRGSENQSYYRYSLDVNGERVPMVEPYLTDELTRRAIEFVRRHRGEPFFLHLAHYAPHRPLEAPAELIEFYQKKGVEEPIAKVYAMIEILDRGIGEVLAELDRLGLAENTVVFFASDNGPDPIPGPRFNEPLRGTKYQVYEGGIRVPLMVRWPGKFAPRRCDGLVHFVDFLPTILELCDVDIPQDRTLDGTSFRDLLTGQAEREDPARFWQWNRAVPNYTHNAAMHRGKWKLMRPYVTRESNPQDSKEPPVLYNLSRDPSETTDVSAEHPRLYREMLDSLNQWCEEMERDRTDGVEKAK